MSETNRIPAMVIRDGIFLLYITFFVTNKFVTDSYDFVSRYVREYILKNCQYSRKERSRVKSLLRVYTFHLADFSPFFHRFCTMRNVAVRARAYITTQHSYFIFYCYVNKDKDSKNVFSVNG